MQKRLLKNGFLVGLILSVTVMVSAQEVEKTPFEQLESQVDGINTTVGFLNKFKLSGYVQSDFQFGQEKAKLKVGTAKLDDETFYMRMGIRRGRVKLTYTDLVGKMPTSAAFQLDITEKAIKVKDANFTITDPWINCISLKTGIYDRPFGYEISYSSSLMESPERSTGCVTLFPDEQDLGATLIFQGPKNTFWNNLKLETGLFAGNAINQDNDNKKDWISHVSYKQSFDNVQFGLGGSLYYGSLYQGNDTVFEMKDKEFEIIKTDGLGKYSERMYYGGDAQLLISTGLGMTNLRAEVVAGKQPGIKGSSASPSVSTFTTDKTYRRDFLSFVVYFIQDFGPHSLVLKYDQYDPNTHVAGDEIGEGGTTKTDIKKQNFGFGYIYRVNANFRVMGYFDWAMNETSKNLSGYDKDLLDNIITLRLQYKF